MHRTHDAQIRQAGMRKLFVCESPRDDSDDAPSFVQARIRQDTHQADIAATVHQDNTALGKQPSDALRSLLIAYVHARIRSAKYTNSFQHGCDCRISEHAAALID